MPKRVPIETKSRKSVSVIATVKPNWRALEEGREDLFTGGDSIVGHIEADISFVSIVI